MVTMQDIAERAGVNKGTVSYVLNGKQKKARISAETCEKIKAIANELGYRRNELARSVATGKSHVIAFVSCNTGSWEYTAKIMVGILDEVSRQGYSLKVYDLSGEDSMTIAEKILQQRVDGVIFHSSSVSDFEPVLDVMKKNYIPCATVNLTSGNAMAGVTTDDSQGIKDAVKHLAELGHKRIMYFSHKVSGDEAEYVKNRREGYLAGMREYVGSAEVPRIEALPQLAPDEKAAITRVLQEAPGKRPSAIICINDIQAMEVLQIAYRHGIRIPDQLSVVGFADLDIAGYSMVPLTTVSQPFEEMGHEAAAILLEIVKDKKFDITQRLENRKLKVELVIRDSTALPADNSQ